MLGVSWGGLGGFYGLTVFHCGAQWKTIFPGTYIKCAIDAWPLKSRKKMIHLRFGDVELQPCSDMSSSSKSSIQHGRSQGIYAWDATAMWCFSQVWPLTQFLFCFRAFVGNFFKPILDFVKPTEKNWNRVSDQICPHNRVGRSKSQLGGSGGGPGVLGGWGLGNVCLLQMHSNAILGPHPGPSPELSKTWWEVNRIKLELSWWPDLSNSEDEVSKKNNAYFMQIYQVCTDCTVSRG